jgi:hypothetical protein
MTGGFARMWRESELFARLRGPQGGACSSCRHYDACRGGCMAAKFFTGLLLDGADPEYSRSRSNAAGEAAVAFMPGSVDAAHAVDRDVLDEQVGLNKGDVGGRLGQFGALFGAGGRDGIGHGSSLGCGQRVGASYNTECQMRARPRDRPPSGRAHRFAAILVTESGCGHSPPTMGVRIPIPFRRRTCARDGSRR